MEKATPLTQLKPNNSDRDIIDNVLNELDDPVGPSDDEDYDTIHNQQQDRYRQYQHDPTQHPPSSRAGNDGDGTEQMANYDEPSWLQIIWEELKSPLLFALLFVALSQPIVHKTILKYLPENGMDAMYSMGIRALIGAVLFYILRNFIMTMLWIKILSLNMKHKQV